MFIFSLSVLFYLNVIFGGFLAMLLQLLCSSLKCGAKSLPFLAASPGRTTTTTAVTTTAASTSQTATTSSATSDRVVYVYSDKIEVRTQKVKTK